MVFLDIRIPSYPDKKIYSGEDLADLMRKEKIKSNISIEDRLYSVYRNVEPEGIIIKDRFGYLNSEWNCQKYIVYV